MAQGLGYKVDGEVFPLRHLLGIFDDFGNMRFCVAMVQFVTFCARLRSLIVYRGNKRLEAVFDIAVGIDGLPFIHAV